MCLFLSKTPSSFYRRSKDDAVFAENVRYLRPMVEGCGGVEGGRKAKSGETALTIPAEEEADAGGEESGTKAAVEPGEEVGWDAGNMLQPDTEGNHEGDNEIALEAEGPEDAGFLFRHGHDAGGVFADDTGEHPVESGKDQEGQRYHPQEVLRPVHQKIMTHSGDGYLRPYGRPEEAIHSKEMFRLDLHFAKLIIISTSFDLG